MKYWWNDYIGIPYKLHGRDLNGVDCWGLVRLVHKDQKLVDLPSFSTNYDNTEDVEHLAELISRNSEGWEPVLDTYTECDVVLFRINGHPSHVGIIVGENKFIHSREGKDVAIESLDSPIWRRRIVGVYRYVRGVSVNAIPNALRTTRVNFSYAPGSTIQEIVDQIATTGAGNAVVNHLVFVDGVPVDKTKWSTTVLKNGEILDYRVVPAGGGVGRLLAFAAIAYLAIVAGPMVVNAIAGTAGTAAAGTVGIAGMSYATSVAVVGMSINLVGGLLINALFPVRPPEINNPGSTNKNLTQLQGGSNQANKYGSIPVVLGKMRFTPPIGANTYIENDGDTSYLNMLLVWGYGPLQISDLRIGDIPIDRLEEVDYEHLNDEINEDAADVKAFNALYSSDVVQQAPQVQLKAQKQLLSSITVTKETLVINDVSTAGVPVFTVQIYTRDDTKVHNLQIGDPINLRWLDFYYSNLEVYSTPSTTSFKAIPSSSSDYNKYYATKHSFAQRLLDNRYHYYWSSSEEDGLTYFTGGNAWQEFNLDSQDFSKISVTLSYPNGLYGINKDNANDIKLASDIQVQIREINDSNWNEVKEAVVGTTSPVKLDSAWYNTDDDAALEPVYRWTRVYVTQEGKLRFASGQLSNTIDKDATGKLLERLKAESGFPKVGISRLPQKKDDEVLLYSYCVYGDKIVQVVDHRSADIESNAVTRMVLSNYSADVTSTYYYNRDEYGGSGYTEDIHNGTSNVAVFYGTERVAAKNVTFDLSATGIEKTSDSEYIYGVASGVSFKISKSTGTFNVYAVADYTTVETVNITISAVYKGYTVQQVFAVNKQTPDRANTHSVDISVAAGGVASLPDYPVFNYNSTTNVGTKSITLKANITKPYRGWYWDRLPASEKTIYWYKLVSGSWVEWSAVRNKTSVTVNASDVSTDGLTIECRVGGRSNRVKVYNLYVVVGDCDSIPAPGTNLSAARTVTIASGRITRMSMPSNLDARGVLHIAGILKNPFNKTVTFNLKAPGKYVVRVRELTSYSDSPHNIVNTCTLQYVTGYLAKPPIVLPKDSNNKEVRLVRTALRIRATNQLNNTLDGITGTVLTLGEDLVYSGNNYASGVWTPNLPIRNPAALFRYVLTHQGNAKAKDLAIDDATMKDWYHYCKQNGFTYDNILLDPKSLVEVLKDIAAAGRASPTLVDGRWSVVVDRPRTFVAQHFSTHNSWGFEGSRTFMQMPHGFRVNFINSTAGFKSDEMIVYNDGYSASNATLFETIELPGVTTPTLVYKHARFHLAQLKLRPETYVLNVDIEHLVCTRGDLVRVTHDVPMWGLASARINSIELPTDTSRGLIITLDEAVPIDNTTVYGLRIRTSEGVSAELRAKKIATDGYYSSLEILTEAGQPVRSTTVSGTGYAGSSGTIRVLDLVLIGLLNKESVELVVQKIEPAENYTARLTLVDYAPVVYTSDTQAIPAFTSNITIPPTLQESVIQSAPKILTSKIVSDHTVMELLAPNTYRYKMVVPLELTDVKQLPAQKITHIEGQIRIKPDSVYDVIVPATSWKDTQLVKIDSSSITFTNVKEGEEYDIRVRYISSDGRNGPWSAQGTASSLYASHIIVGRTANPSTPTGLVATMVATELRLDWVDIPDIDVAGYEVRTVDADWGDNTKVTDRKYKGTDSKCIINNIPEDVQVTYYVKAYDVLGKYSTTPAQVKFTLDSPANVTSVTVERVGTKLKITPNFTGTLPSNFMYYEIRVIQGAGSGDFWNTPGTIATTIKSGHALVDLVGFASPRLSSAGITYRVACRMVNTSYVTSLQSALGSKVMKTI